MGVWKLVGFPPDAGEAKADGEDDGCNAEEEHGKESDPAGVGEDAALPVGNGEKDYGCGDSDAADENAEEDYTPFVGQGGGGNAGGRAVVNCDAFLH